MTQITILDESDESELPVVAFAELLQDAAASRQAIRIELTNVNLTALGIARFGSIVGLCQKPLSMACGDNYFVGCMAESSPINNTSSFDGTITFLCTGSLGDERK